MAVIKADVPDPVKERFKQAAKNAGKSESKCLREAIKNYLSPVKIAQR